MRHMAHYDLLTELPNRALITERLQQSVIKARRDKTNMAVMFLDLDRFKPVNDSLGHDIGDMLLKQVARRLLSSIRESDTVSRLGGDEFVVLLPSIEHDRDATIVAEKILQTLNLPFEVAGHAISISGSIGIATYPAHGADEKLLLINADIAMYHAKKGGRNNYRLFAADMAS
jgi:diguanylate cyclase (GGDEF)-like protein